MKKERIGYFVISLDFELFWGVLDKFSLQEYGENILNVSKVIEKLLKIFNQYKIHATWAVVGNIFYEKEEFFSKDILKPIGYKNQKLSAYNYLDFIKNSNKNLFFGNSIIKKIKETENQEIGTHTLSHYFVCEEGQEEFEFDYEIKMVKKIYTMNNLELKSIVFPKNQINSKYNNILKKYGIKYFRGNEKNLFYKYGKREKENKIIRLGRFLDSYIKLGGNYTYKIEDIYENGFLNIRASRFLRPYNPKIAFLDFLKINRIKKQMKNAAKKGEIFHLWWHPHNFGKDLEKNILMLTNILDYYNYLEKKYNFKSKNMNEIGEEYENFDFRKRG